MIKQHYEKASRRALNMIWNAAGRYDFDPCFMAFHSNGQADDYFNTVIGLADKWLDLSGIAAFFSSYTAHPKAEEFDEFLWLGLENYLFERELPERPVLEQMRKERGEVFFRIQQTLSEQQMTLQSMPVYRQQQARWASVTGRHLPVLSAKETRMMEALRFSGTLDAAGVSAAMRAFLTEFFRYDPVTDPRIRQELKGLRAWYRRLVSQEYRQKDILLIRTGSGTGDPANAVQLRWEGRKPVLRSPQQDEEDREYIESLFGPCRLSDTELAQAESILCTGSDTGCRLWFTRSAARHGPDAQTDKSREAADALRRMLRQYDHNRRYLEAHRLMISESIKKLSSELEVLLASFSRGLPETARTGKLIPEKTYRVSLLHDPLVFTREGDEREVQIGVDLLLDASQSRMNSQERIAAEAYMIADSLVRCHVPVSVTAFRSLRGYTVLEELKSSDGNDCSGILHYYAGGWNRDGLALKAMRWLFCEGSAGGQQAFLRDPGDLRLLLVLTDASPNDTVADSAFGRNYEGAAAVDDAAAAVKALRSEGIRTAAVFHGSTSHLENVCRIYGKEYIRVRSLQRFADGVTDLLQKLLSEI